MKHKDPLILLGTVALLAAGGFVALGSWGDGARAADLAPFVPTATSDPDGGPDTPADEFAAPPPTPAGPTVDGARQPQPWPDDAPPTHGVIDGRVQLAANVPQLFGSYTIALEELINETNADLHPDRKPLRSFERFDIDFSSSPQYFELKRVPFSPYGYRVSVIAAGVNGSTQIVRLSEDFWNPQVTLTITPAAPFSLRLIDQYRNPHVGDDVVLMPIGNPVGRPRLTAQTDAFGTAVYESVLAGSYQVVFADQVRSEIDVLPPGFSRDDAQLGVQSKIIEVPSGSSLRVEIVGNGGYGVQDATVDLFAIDTLENRRLSLPTDRAGIATFAHVTPGHYQLNVQKKRMQPTSRRVEIEPDAGEKTLRIRLAWR